MWNNDTANPLLLNPDEIMRDGYDFNSIMIDQNAVRNINEVLIKRKIYLGLQARQLIFDGKGSEAVFPVLYVAYNS